MSDHESGFSADWLALREDCDARSRSDELIERLRARLPSRPLCAMDLGAGTGANIRHLAPRLGGAQRWLAVEHDPALIARQPARLEGADYACLVQARRLDLSIDLQSLPFADHALVTASALLDLVSTHWLEQLAALCGTAGAVALFALTYDGRVQCIPRESDDDWLIALVNEHQRGEKGFGPALGPRATARACSVFEERGFRTHVAASDWLIEPQERSLQAQLIDGWLEAAKHMASGEHARLERWAARRRAHLAAGISRIRVGHQDMLAWPTAPGG